MKIPVYEQQTTTQAISNVQPVTATQSVDVSQGLGQLAAGIGQIGSAMAHNEQEQQRLNKEQMQIQLEKQKQADTAWSASTLAKEKLRTQQDYYQRQNQLTGAGSGFVQTLQSDYAKQDEDILASAPNEQAKEFMQKQLGEYRSSMLLDAAKYENDKFHSFNIQQFDAAKDSSSQSVYNDPGSYGKVFAEQSTLIDASGLPDETRFKLKQQLKQSMGDAYYTGSMAKPGGAKRVLEEINSFKGLSQDQQAAQQAAQMAGANPTHFLVASLAESGHQWTHAKDKNGKEVGTASGPHQIIDKTFTGWGGDLSKKNDPTHYYQTAAKGAKQTEDDMTHLLGRAPTGGEFLGGWMLGKSDAAKVYTAENNTRLSDVLSSDVIKNNGLEGKTVGEYKSEKEQLYAKKARSIIDTTNSPQVTFDQRAKIERQAEAQLTQEASLYKAQLDNQVTNDSALASQGLPIKSQLTLANFNAANPKDPAKAKIEYDAYASKMQVGQRIQTMKYTPIPKLQEWLDNPNNKPDSNSPNFAVEQEAYKQKTEAAQQIIKQYNEDPVKYSVANNQVLTRAYNAAKANPTSENKQVYMTNLIAAQQLGDPNAPVKLLTSNQENQIVAQMAASKGSDFTNNIKQLQNEYGNNWPLVARQLSQNKAYPAMANVITNINNPNVADKLANVSGMPITELYKNIPKQQELEGFKSAVNDNLADFIHSLPQGATRDGVTSTYNEAVQRIALSYIQGGTSQGEAIKKATNEVLNDQYAFVPNSNKSDLTMRIPKNNPKDDSSDIIASGAERYIKKIGDLPLTYVTSHEKWRDSKDLKANTISNIQDNGYWVTNDDETGMYLYTVDDNNIHKPVLNATGKPVNLTWDQLKSADQEQKTVVANKIHADAKTLLTINK